MLHPPEPTPAGVDPPCPASLVGSASDLLSGAPASWVLGGSASGAGTLVGASLVSAPSSAVALSAVGAPSPMVFPSAVPAPSSLVFPSAGAPPSPAPPSRTTGSEPSAATTPFANVTRRGRSHTEKLPYT